MSKKVIYAKLHAGIFIPSVGNLSETLPPQGKTLKNFTMEKRPDGNLSLSWDDLASATHNEAEVGSSNIVVLVYESEKLRGNNA